MSREGTVNRCGYSGQQKGTIVMLVDYIHRFETYWSSFLPSLIDSLCLRVAQMPWSPDLAIFVRTTDDRYNQLLYPLLHMHAPRNTIILWFVASPIHWLTIVTGFGKTRHVARTRKQRNAMHTLSTSGQKMSKSRVRLTFRIYLRRNFTVFVHPN